MLRFAQRFFAFIWEHRPSSRLFTKVAIAASVGCLCILLVPAVTTSIDRRHREHCRDNLKQIGLAIHNYGGDGAILPPAAITSNTKQPLLSWRVAILPQLGYGGLYARFHLGEPWDSPHNLALLKEMPKEYACPRGRHPRGHTVYKGIVGTQAAFELTRGVDIREFLDGTSNTVLVGETASSVPWTKPEDQELVDGGLAVAFSSWHHGGFNVLFVDGSSRFIKHTIAPDLLRSLLTRDGGEVVSA
jgi:prepilin-type processing-associated H-X9-DG protein